MYPKCYKPVLTKKKHSEKHDSHSPGGRPPAAHFVLTWGTKGRDLCGVSKYTNPTPEGSALVN